MIRLTEPIPQLRKVGPRLFRFHEPSRANSPATLPRPMPLQFHNSRIVYQSYYSLRHLRVQEGPGKNGDPKNGSQIVEPSPTNLKLSSVDDLYEILGHEKIVDLSTKFYTRAYADTEDKEFRGLFDNPIEHAIQAQSDFFIERWGGPQLFSQSRGPIALRMRHNKFRITRNGAERWLFHMNLALDDVEIKGETKELMFDFLTKVAHHLVNSRE